MQYVHMIDHRLLLRLTSSYKINGGCPSQMAPQHIHFKSGQRKPEKKKNDLFCPFFKWY